jgi:hypothetical protein
MKIRYGRCVSNFSQILSWGSLLLSDCRLSEHVHGSVCHGIGVVLGVWE